MLERVDVHDGEARDVNGQPHLQWWGRAIVGTTIAKVSAWCRRATNMSPTLALALYRGAVSYNLDLLLSAIRIRSADWQPHLEQ